MTQADSQFSPQFGKIQPIAARAVTLGVQRAPSTRRLSPRQVHACWQTITGDYCPLPFPIAIASLPERAWKPTLAGEGEFVDSPIIDASEMARMALERLESGMLRLHAAAGTDPNDWQRPRAA